MKLTKAKLKQLIQEELNEQVYGGQKEASAAVVDAYYGPEGSPPSKWQEQGYSPSDLQFKGYDEAGNPKVELGDWVVDKSELFPPAERTTAEPSFEPLSNPDQLLNLRDKDPNEFLRQTRRFTTASAAELADYNMRKKTGFKSAAGRPEGAPPAPESEAYLDALRTAPTQPMGGDLEEGLQRIVQEELEALLQEALDAKEQTRLDNLKSKKNKSKEEKEEEKKLKHQ